MVRGGNRKKAEAADINAEHIKQLREEARFVITLMGTTNRPGLNTNVLSKQHQTDANVDVVAAAILSLRDPTIEVNAALLAMGQNRFCQKQVCISTIVFLTHIQYLVLIARSKSLWPSGSSRGDTRFQGRFSIIPLGTCVGSMTSS